VGTVALTTLHSTLLHLALRRVLMLVLMAMCVGMGVCVLLFALLIADTRRIMAILATHICNLRKVDL
jgi:hypothetical protein